MIRLPSAVGRPRLDDRSAKLPLSLEAKSSRESVLKTRVAICAAAALVNVRHRILEGATPPSNKTDHALRQHMRLAGAGIGRHPNGGARDPMP